MNMADRISNLIKCRGLTNHAVEKELGFGNGAIRRFATSSPSVDKIVLLSNFLNVSVDYIITGKSGEPCDELPEEEREILRYVDLLTEKEKYILIGELKERTKGRTKKIG